MFDDYPMWLEIAYRHKIGYINKPLMFYRLSPGSMSRGLDSYKKMISSQVMLLQDIHKKYDVNIDYALRKTYIFAAAFFLKHDRTQYPLYRDKIRDKKVDTLVLDLHYYLRLKPVRNKFVTAVQKLI